MGPDYQLPPPADATQSSTILPLISACEQTGIAPEILVGQWWAETWVRWFDDDGHREIVVRLLLDDTAGCVEP